MPEPKPKTEVEEIMKVVGLRIAARRLQRKLSQKTLSVEAGLYVSHLSKIERGKSNPSVLTLVKISTCLDVSLSELFDNTQETTGLMPIAKAFPEAIRGIA